MIEAEPEPPNTFLLGLAHELAIDRASADWVIGKLADGLWLDKEEPCGPELLAMLCKIPGMFVL